MASKVLTLLLVLASANKKPHKFFDHDDFDPTDYNLFDSFEGYTWHKIQNTREQYSQFYIEKQADKEFKELLNIVFDVDIVYINGKIKPTFDGSEVYPNQNTKKNDGTTPSDFKKDTNEVAANVFRQGYSTRTFMGYNMFNYREDNVQKKYKQLDFETKSNEVTFGFKFNLNEIAFNSRLNEDLINVMKKSNYHQDFVEPIIRDY